VCGVLQMASQVLLASRQRGGPALARLARPFPLTRAWIWEDGEAAPDQGITRNQVWDGALLLGHDGCGMYWTLVVTGTHRGQTFSITQRDAVSRSEPTPAVDSVPA